jgi:hypothetical protein
MVPHVAAHKTHQRVWEFSSVTPKRLLQQYRHITDMPVRADDVRFWGKAEMACCTASEKPSFKNLETGASRNAQLLAAKVSNPRYRGKVRNTADISKGVFELGMCEFESSQVSQAFLFSENCLFLIRKARQMRAFLIAWSLQRPMFALSGPTIPKSLRTNSIKLPFFQRLAPETLE